MSGIQESEIDFSLLGAIDSSASDLREWRTERVVAASDGGPVILIGEFNRGESFGTLIFQYKKQAVYIPHGGQLSSARPLSATERKLLAVQFRAEIAQGSQFSLERPRDEVTVSVPITVGAGDLKCFHSTGDRQ